jgi:hypothetical protein
MERRKAMKSMAMMLGAMLCWVSVVVSQENDWLSGTWKGIRKLEFASNPNMRQRQALNSPGSETVLHLQYNPATRAITGQGEAQNLRIASSHFTETVLEGSFFDGDKGVLILQQTGGLTDGAVRKYVMERQRDGSLYGYYDEPKTRVTINLKKQ